MQTPILIVGAGPTGLSSSILLSRFGISSLVVERHSSTSIHPKATAISTRVMELFRAWGIESQIREAAMPIAFASSIRSNLASPELERRSLGFPTQDEAAPFSPTYPAALAQDVLEPILLERARSYAGAEVRFNTEVVDLEQDATGVRATIVNRETGERAIVHARYVIAADGASSPIRRHLGIAMRGVERIGAYLSVLFRADLDSVITGERTGLYMLQGLGGPMPSVALPTNNDGRWVLATPWRDDVRPVSSLTPADLTELVRRAAGRPDLDVQLIDHDLVGIGAGVAERFRDGNVFLVGDAAHRTAPTGGTGMNTAIQSAHNLIWKLAAVMFGIAGADVLDTYEPERRPSGERNVLRSTGQLQGISGIAADMGVVYSSRAVLAVDGVDRPAVIEPTMQACVGSRAPHAWLVANGERVSTLDLFGQQMMLVTGVKGRAWRDAAELTAEGLDVPLGTVVVGGEWHPTDDRWLSAYGIDADGAVLVRPDGYIAWRSVTAAADPVATLTEVVARVLCLVDRTAAGFVNDTDLRCA